MMLTTMSNASVLFFNPFCLPLPNVTWHSGTWPYTMTPPIDQKLHKFATLLPNLTLLPILTLLPNFGGFHRTLQRVRLANRGRLLLRTPGPVPFGTCICWCWERSFLNLSCLRTFWVSNIPRYFYFALSSPPVCFTWRWSDEVHVSRLTGTSCLYWYCKLFGPLIEDEWHIYSLFVYLLFHLFL